MIPRPPSSTLFLYTTLFRSAGEQKRPARTMAETNTATENNKARPRLRTLVGVVASDKGDKTIKVIVNFQTKHARSEEHTSELQSRLHLVCRLLLEKKKKYKT